MNKTILVIVCLMTLACAQTVLRKNQCNDCAQFKSQKDCVENEQIADTCEWIEASSKCQKKTPTQEETAKTYCQTVDKPDANCASTFGCAYVNNVCTPFSGCSAYVKTTTTECQAISYFCVSDGTSCIEAKGCDEYTQSQTQCESTPSISGIKKCKWDNGTCRNYVCSEAESTLNTDLQCKTWLGGCITRLKGCWSSPLPTCSTYDLDTNQCAYRGSDGLCEPDTTSTKCKAKDCANAATTVSSDDECKAYQDGCISNGKGCIKAATKPLCSSYTGDSTTCVGYIGSDGVCEGDAGGTKCRARKCENGLFNTDELCKNYQKDCVTNGKVCTLAKSLCSLYKGTATTCAAYIGTDGLCKGTSTTTEAACAPKVCEEAPLSTTTNDACNKYQTGCVTTGAGCVSKSNLKSCTTYDGDSASCLTKVGSEGNCMWKSGTKCVARSCDGAATTLNSTQSCLNYFTGCVTTGAGCVASTTCDLTVKQQSCEGTTGCGWQPVCSSNSSCFQFKKKSICLANQARVYDYTKEDGTMMYKSQKCAWLNGVCKDLECSDLTGTYYNNDTNCSNELSTCMSNRVDACITKSECNKLKGTKATCLTYPGYCTNVDAATDDTACTNRQCTDNTTASDNQTCEQFNPGCISNGAGCVLYSTTCSGLKGTQTTCNNLYGYKSGSSSSYTTQQCYNTSTAVATDNCVIKTCKKAEGATDGTCASFLTGTTCAYDGNGSCVDPKTAVCSDYTGDATFCGNAIVGDHEAGYCFGSGGACKTRACSDNSTATTDSACHTFLPGCIAKTEGGCITRSARACSGQNGTVTGTTACTNFSGGISATDKVQCTKYDKCADRACADITSPTQASDCTNYLSTCRFLKSGTACISQGACNSYNLPDTATTNQSKLDYCTTITDTNGKSCGYTNGTKCADRTCDQLNLSDLTTKPTCTTYITADPANTIFACKSAGNICYTPNSSCTAYTNFDSAADNAGKLTQCKKYYNTNNVMCTYVDAEASCTEQNTCEKVITQTDAKVCNDFLATTGICQKVTNSGCETTTVTCTDYKIGTAADEAAKKLLCSSLKVIVNDTTFAQGTAVYKSCIWKSSVAATCSAIASCADITTATSQADCNKQFTGCFYYGGLCYAGVASGACPTTFPTGISTDTQKSLYCGSLKEATADTYCMYDQATNKCITGTAEDCTAAISGTTWDTIGSTANAAGYKAAFCAARTLKDRSKVCKVDADDDTKCAAGTCEDIPSPTSQGDCDNHILGCVFSNNKCWTSAVAADGDCNDTAKVAFDNTVFTKATDAATTYCQKHYKQDSGNTYCTHDQYKTGGAEDKCVAAGPCSSIILPSDATKISAYCQSKVNAAGLKCAFTATACRDWDCFDVTGATSQVDCDLGAPGKTCQYYKGTCYNTTDGCDKIPAGSSGQKAYCDALTSSTVQCTYISGANCTPRDDCTAYDVTDVTAANRKAACDSLFKVGSTTTKCTYIQGTKCVELGACSTYDGTTTAENGPAEGSEEAECLAVTDTDSKPCIKDSAKLCRAQTCEDNDVSSNACSTNATGCVYYNTKCITKVAGCADYTPVGDTDTAKKAWCEGIINSGGNKCAWDGTSDCKDRTCDDVVYYTDADCSNYLKTCKTNGVKCVAIGTTACNSLDGSQAFCESILDSTGKDKCKLTSTADTASTACKAKTCYDNVTATSDTECDQFLTGCVTRGVGCIPNDTPCTSYKGTKTTCETFKQYIGLDADDNPTYTYCSGDATNTITSFCKVRTCGDNTAATDDTTCNSYLTGCVTKGTGCIEATAACTQYKGDQTTCQKFKGTSGADYCWNTGAAAATAFCTKKKCSDISGSNNQTCNDGMKPAKTTDPALCVYDGNGCVDNTKSCSQFQGTEETCPTYIATNGPCKSTTVGTAKGACTQKVCTEAPNTLTTDADCKTYHPNCYTTGYGCTSVKQCYNLTNQASCKARPECTWANQCYSQTTTCSTYTGTNQSTCLNASLSDGKKCAWTETGNVCRPQTCEDQPDSYTTHDKCKGFSDSCTTTGAGCITRTACINYTNPTTCKNASINADGTGRCGWDLTTNKCRNRICADKTDGKSDDDCNTFLADCKTNGTSCVSGSSCGDFTTAKYCLSSTTGPCLWVNGICYNYDRCEDALMKTHSDCQKFSGMCTTNGSNCVPITSCRSTTLKASCVLGTDGACGWLPTGTCQKFGQCSDAAGTINDDCQSYGTSCYTDGTACVTQGKCSDYKTPTACGNMGTDGICFFNTTSNTCKLKECSDVQSGTYDACKVITITGTSSCTTNGTNCINQGTCSSYVEAGCYYGTDGDCTFAAAVGAAAGATKTCRLKQCEDIADGKNNAACNGVITNKKCVSNGTNCIAKAACSSYTNVISCNGGGIDGTNQVICAFTPKSDTDKVNGTCKAFSQCTDASKDQIACSSNPSCKWTGGATTSCQPHDCASFASGSDCQPIPSFDGGSSYTVCVLTNGVCTKADPGTITSGASTCYTKSAYTYSWNQATSKCEGCLSSSTNNNNSNGTNNGTNGTDTTEFGYTLSIISLGLLGFMA